eukprot:364429-Chlamydomonas_euryale.AAC.1
MKGLSHAALLHAALLHVALQPFHHLAFPALFSGPNTHMGWGVPALFGALASLCPPPPTHTHAHAHAHAHVWGVPELFGALASRSPPPPNPVSAYPCCISPQSSLCMPFPYPIGKEMATRALPRAGKSPSIPHI